MIWWIRKSKSWWLDKWNAWLTEWQSLWWGMHCVCHITLGHIFHKICELEYLMEIIEISNAGKQVQFLTGKTDRKSGSRKKITHGLTAERYWQSSLDHLMLDYRKWNSLAQFRMSITRIYLPIWRHFFSINGKVILSWCFIHYGSFDHHMSILIFAYTSKFEFMFIKTYNKTVSHIQNIFFNGMALVWMDSK